MKKFNIETGLVRRVIEAKSEDEALKYFFSNIKASQLGVAFSISEIDENKNEKGSRFGPTEPALKKLGLYSRFEKTIEFLRESNKRSKNAIVYDE